MQDDLHIQIMHVAICLIILEVLRNILFIIHVGPPIMFNIACSDSTLFFEHMSSWCWFSHPNLTTYRSKIDVKFIVVFNLGIFT